MNDNETVGPTLPEGVQLHPDFGDAHQMLNMRGWLQKAVEKAGGEMTGGGCGMGEADIDVTLDGHEFNITIKPILKPEKK